MNSNACNNCTTRTTRDTRDTRESLKVLVLMGGPSNERAVSLLSGAAVAEALSSLGHVVTRADVGPDDVSTLDAADCDAVFIAMHGAFGEDGQVQQLCVERGLPYVGSTPQACRRAMDKAAAKGAFRAAGLATPDWTVLDAAAADDLDARLTAFGLPCVLKPLSGGSSLDLFIVEDAAELRRNAEHLLARYGRALLERYVPGREFTVAVLGERALPLIEIVPAAGRKFYDYAAKYDDDATAFVFDHGLPESVAAAMAEAALAAHRHLGCRDVSRADFRLDESGAAWLLEVNVIPGLTGHSLLPKAAARTGMSFPRMCEALVRMALRRGPDPATPATPATPAELARPAAAAMDASLAGGAG